MSVIDANVAKAQSAINTDYETKVMREGFNAGIEQASALGQTSTQFEKKYYDLSLIMSEITAAGYVITDEGTYYLVDWS